MVGRRRGRTGRGWDASPPRQSGDPAGDAEPGQERRTRRPSGQSASAAEPVDPGERAREICLRLLAVRPRTRTELAKALRQRGIADEVAAEVLARYGEVGMVDDQAFARAWVSSRHHGRGLARRALAAELRHKGVDSETVGVALDDLAPETEAATARALVDRKLRTEPPPRPTTDSDQDDSDGGGDRWDGADHRAATERLARRLVGMLARKGYPPGLAIRVVREALAEWASDVDTEGDWENGLDDS